MIIYAPDADADVTRHHDRLEEFSSGAAEAFMKRLADAEQRIEAHPRTYRLLRNRETRRFSFKLNRTTYLIDYHVEPS